MVRWRLVAAVLALLVPIAGAVECVERWLAPTAPAAAAAPPNVVLLVLDDLDAAMGGAGAMASASWLAALGTSFTRFFTSTPLCCPTRASLLTGQFAHNHGVLTAAPPLGGFARVLDSGLEDDALQEAGYRTALIGKYFNGYPRAAGASYVPPGWDEWLSPLWGAGFSYFDYEVNDNGRIAAWGDAFVFLTSDNGFHLGHHRLRAGKGSPYEEDVRVPLLVAGPGVPPGRRLPHLALAVDLAPTIAALAGT
ncbi:MAG: sulfatase-like hydrolase/transferase, partial [Thermoanaerobaculia bacterium]